MKKTLLLIIIFLITSCNRAYISGVTSRGTNILYSDVENIIEIKSNSKKEIIVTVDNGSIEKLSVNTYSIVVKNLLPTNLKIKQGSNHSNFEFRTKLIPNPTIIFGFPDGSSNVMKYSADKFRKLKYITPRISDFDYTCSYEIGYYDIIVMKRNGKRKTFNNVNKNQFPSYIVDDVESGDVFIFCNIEINFIEKFEKQVKIDDVVVMIE